MGVPTAGELLGGFWAGGYPSGPVDAYALAGYLIGRNAAGLGAEAPLRGWQVRADERVSPGPDGRPTYGYPAPTPGGDPVWVAYDFVGGAVLAAGPDFTVADGYVWFETDPVLAGTVKGHVWADAGPVATAYLLWSPGRPAATPAAPNAGTYAALAAAVAAACDSPRTGTGVETVEETWLGPDDRWRVVTDVAAYRLPEADTPGVATGDLLPPCHPLGRAWRLHRLGLPYPALDRVVVPPAFLPASGVEGPVAFYDHAVATVVDTDGGRTRVRFPVGAESSGDADAFWAAGHAWGTGAGGRTLAEALDTRADPQTEPTAADLPGSVNPMEVACRLVFGGAAYLLVVDEDKFGPAAEADAAARAARYAAAAGPHAAVIEWTGGAQPEPAEIVPT